MGESRPPWKAELGIRVPRLESTIVNAADMDMERSCMERCRRGSGSLGTVLAESDDFLDRIEEFGSTYVLEWSAKDDEVGELLEAELRSAVVSTCKGLV